MSDKNNKMKKQILSVLVGLCVAGGTYAWISHNGQGGGMAPPGGAPNAHSAKKTATLVSVVNFKAGSNHGLISGFSEVSPRYTLALKTEVAGKITFMSDSFESGSVVKKGDVLFKIDDTEYKSALASAKSSLSEAKVNYYEEERESEQALIEWKRSGLKGNPDSPLVLRKPYLEQAKSALDSAKVAVEKAQKDLNNTVVKAPYDGVISARDVQLGGYVSVGTQSATFLSSDRFDVSLPIPESDWSALSFNYKDIANKSIKSELMSEASTNSEKVAKWTGYISRFEKSVNESSRTRSVIVSVDAPLEQNLYPGSYVTVSIDTKSFGNSLLVPESFRAVSGDFWYVDEDSKLQKFTPNVRYSFNGKLIIDNPFNKGSINLVEQPRLTFASIEGDVVTVQKGAEG